MQPPISWSQDARCRTPAAEAGEAYLFIGLCEMTSFLLFYYLYISYRLIAGVNK